MKPSIDYITTYYTFLNAFKSTSSGNDALNAATSSLVGFLPSARIAVATSLCVRETMKDAEWKPNLQQH